MIRLAPKQFRSRRACAVSAAGTAIIGPCLLDEPRGALIISGGVGLQLASRGH